MNRRTDSEILAAIRAFDGVPNSSVLASSLRMRKTDLADVLHTAQLAQAMQARGTEYLASLSIQQIFAISRSGGVMGRLPAYAQGIVRSRVRAVLLDEINNYNGVSTKEVLSTSLASRDCHIHDSTIQTYLDQNPSLVQAMQARGTEYLASLSIQQIFAISPLGSLVNCFPLYAQEIIHSRIDEVLLGEILGYPEVPSASGLSKSLESKSCNISTKAILHRLNPQINPERAKLLSDAMQARGTEYLTTLPPLELVKKYNAKGWIPNLPDYAKVLAYQRLDQILLENIPECDEVPNAVTLSGLLVSKGFLISNFRILDRLNPQINPERAKLLSDAMQARGTEYLTTLPPLELVKKYNAPGWFTGLPEYAKARVYVRIDNVLLEEIRLFDSISSIEKLRSSLLSRKELGISEASIRVRLNSNPSLWIAYCTKKGLTEDQAVELALERGEESEAMSAVLKKRLENLHAFREMIGVIQCFPEYLTGNVLEVTLYPEPLKMAAEMLSTPLNSAHEAMQPFRKSEQEPKLSLTAYADVAVLQSIHRLASEGLTELFKEVHRILNAGGVVIATHSTDYTPTEQFLPSLQALEFGLKQQGIIQIDAPSADELVDLGVSPDDVQRISAKVSGESSVLVLTKLTDSDSIVQLPALVKSTAEGNGVAPKTSNLGIDVPRAVSRNINATFLEQASGLLPEAPLLVEIEHESRVVALAGYDMNPKHKGKIESAKYPGAPAEDYKLIARQIAHGVQLRDRLGIKTNAITRVQLSKLKR